MSSQSRLWLIIVIVVLIIGVFFVFYNLQNKSPLSPTIFLSEEEWDFGKIKEDERPVHIFNIKNIGKQELIINRVRASCGCTATMLSQENIQPGKSAELQVTFNPTGYKGVVKKDIYLDSNDPKRPNVKIIVSADVEPIPAPQAILSTTQWELGLINQGDQPTFNFIIENKGEIDLIIEKIEAAEYIKYNYEIPLIIPSGGKEEIVFTYDSTGHQLGVIRDSVRIYCNDPRRKAFSLRIDGYIQERPAPSVSISPGVINFNLEELTEEKLIKEISLTNNCPEAIRITSIDTSSESFRVLKSEVTIAPGEVEDIPIIILKDKLYSPEAGERTPAYLYFTIALPLLVDKQKGE